MLTVVINEIEYRIQGGVSLLEVCQNLGILLPRFCYHESLSLPANCRMCLVEIDCDEEQLPEDDYIQEKPVPSCITEVSDRLIVYTDTPFVKKARESVMEALLLNHPLDCPICDQGGECDLQDQAKKIGQTRSRYFFHKKPVEDKYCGPLIKTIMTRCISCTRCVRYTSEIAGEDFFGTLNRGGHTEVGPYVLQPLSSEISGNVIDLCPVGALTSAGQAFSGRPWELRAVESIDTFDSLGSKIIVEYKENQVYRVIPKSDNTLNGTLISDIGRYAFYANSKKRLLLPICWLGNEDVRNEEERLWEQFGEETWDQFEWKEFFEEYLSYCIGVGMLHTHFIFSERVGVTALALAEKLSSILSVTENTTSISIFTTRKLHNLFLNKPFVITSVLSQPLNAILFLATNPKYESPILNVQLRTKMKDEGIYNFVFGFNFDYNFEKKHLHNRLGALYSSNYFYGKNIDFNNMWHCSSRSAVVLIGDAFENALDNLDAFKQHVATIFSTAISIEVHGDINKLAANYFNINNTYNTIDRISPYSFYMANLLDDTVTTRSFLMGNYFMWYNTHGSDICGFSQAIIPALSVYESEDCYLNLEQRPQKTQISVYTGDQLLAIENLIYRVFSQIGTIIAKKNKSSYNKNVPYDWSPTFRGIVGSLKAQYQYINECLENEAKYMLYLNIKRVVEFVSDSTRSVSYCINDVSMNQKRSSYHMLNLYTRYSSALNWCSASGRVGCNEFVI